MRVLIVLALVAMASARVMFPEMRPLPSPESESDSVESVEIEGPSVDPLPGIPPREPPSILEPEHPEVDPTNPNLKTESHYYPNMINPVVIVHVTMEQDEHIDLPSVQPMPDVPAIDPMPEQPPMWSKEDEGTAETLPAPELPLFPGLKPWIRSKVQSFRFENFPSLTPETRPEPEEGPSVDPLPGIPPREPPSILEPSDRPDPTNPMIPHEEDKPTTEVHYYPNAYNPVVALHVTIDKPEDMELPTPQFPEPNRPVLPIAPELPTPQFPAPEEEFTGVPFLRRFLSPETKPFPENEGPSVDPLPGIPPREPPSILEPEEEWPIFPSEPAVEIFINIRKPQLEDMPGANLPAPELPTPIFPEPEFLRPETRPSLVPEVRPFPLAPELRPLPELLAPETKPEILAPETKPSLVPEVKPWPIPEGEVPEDVWPEYIEPTPLVDIYVHINSKGQASVVPPPIATPY